MWVLLFGVECVCVLLLDGVEFGMFVCVDCVGCFVGIIVYNGGMLYYLFLIDWLDVY